MTRNPDRGKPTTRSVNCLTCLFALKSHFTLQQSKPWSLEEGICHLMHAARHKRKTWNLIFSGRRAWSRILSAFFKASDFLAASEGVVTGMTLCLWSRKLFGRASQLTHARPVISAITRPHEHVFNGASNDRETQRRLTAARILRWPTVSLAVITQSVEHQCFVLIRPFNYKRLIKKRWKIKK